MILVRPAQCLPKSLVGLAEPREGSRELASTRRHSASSGPCDIRDSWRSRLVSVRCDQLHVGVRAIGHDLPLLRWFVAQSISVLAGQIVAHRSNWTPQSTCSESLALFWPYETARDAARSAAKGRVGGVTGTATVVTVVVKTVVRSRVVARLRRARRPWST